MGRTPPVLGALPPDPIDPKESKKKVTPAPFSSLEPLVSGGCISCLRCQPASTTSWVPLKQQALFVSRSQVGAPSVAACAQGKQDGKRREGKKKKGTSHRVSAPSCVHRSPLSHHACRPGSLLCLDYSMCEARTLHQTAGCHLHFYAPVAAKARTISWPRLSLVPLAP